jgi:hypothetical protein
MTRINGGDLFGHDLQIDVADAATAVFRAKSHGGRLIRLLEELSSSGTPSGSGSNRLHDDRLQYVFGECAGDALPSSDRVSD